MSNYDELATSSAYLAGRDAARTLRREGVGWGPDNSDRVRPRGLNADDESAWIRGWESVWA